MMGNGRRAKRLPGRNNATGDRHIAYKLSNLTKNICPRYADHTVNPEMLVPMERMG